MTLAGTHGISVIGVDGHLVRIEASITHGTPGLHLVGLPDRSLSETRDRVRASILNSDLPWPQRHTTVSLTPAALAKTGSAFDLPIAAALLAATGAVPAIDEHTVFYGELSLDGRVRSVPGVLPAVRAAAAAGFTTAVIPAANAAEGLLVPGITAVAVDRLTAVVSHLCGAAPQAARPFFDPSQWPRHRPSTWPRSAGELANLVIPRLAVRAVEVAAAGGHHLWLRGPIESAATQLAEALPRLLPPLTEQQSLEVTSIYSLVGVPDAEEPLITRAPFQAPQHTVNTAGLIGHPFLHKVVPGAVSLAHHGVLLLEEAPEFSPHVLDALRGPLERGEIEFHTSDGPVRLPAACQIAMTSGPCSCHRRRCTCSSSSSARNLHHRLPHSLLRRIDVIADLPDAGVVTDAPELCEATDVIAARVQAARRRAAARLSGHPWISNHQVPGSALTRSLAATPDGLQLIRDAQQAGQITARDTAPILRVAWTIADLDGADRPGTRQVTDALQLRQVTAAHDAQKGPTL
jgi:magnesium chelatase family protein